MKTKLSPSSSKFNLSLVALFSLLGAVTAQAITITQVITHGDTLNGTSMVKVDGTFNLLSLGYDPTLLNIKSASVEFRFSDLDNVGERGYIRFFIPRFSGGNATETFATDTQLNYNQIDHATSPFGDLGITGAVTGQSLATLDSTGLLHYRVNRNQGAFTFDSATLTADVPEGGMTVVMLGLGLCGILMAGKKFKSD